MAVFISEHLKEECPQKENLREIGKSMQESDLADLKKAALKTVLLKDAILNELKNVRAGTLEAIKKQVEGKQLLKLLEKNIVAAKLYERIDRAKMLDETHRDVPFWRIACELAENGYYSKALQVIGKMSLQATKRGALSHIARALAKRGHIDKALEFFEKIPDEGLRTELLPDMARALAKNGRINKALEMAREISDELVLEKTLSYIACRAAKLGNFNQASP